MPAHRTFLAAAAMASLLAPATFAVLGTGPLIWQAAASSGGAGVLAKYIEDSGARAIRQSLEVELTGGPAGVSLTVCVDGRKLARFKTDAVGGGRVETVFKTRRTTLESGVRRPSGFRVDDGSILEVKDAAGVLLRADFQSVP